MPPSRHRRPGSRQHSSRQNSSRRGLLVPLVLLSVFALIVTGTVVALSQVGQNPRSGTCTATGLGTAHTYSAEQTANAALISAVALDRGLPPRAASIALATAYQESKLENIDHGDRDSLGLFQQRPSQDWGTPAQIMDPVHASNAFYDALVRIRGYQQMTVTQAAQKVQRSGYPEAYADHETEGRIYASALTGHAGGNLVCDLAAPEGTASPAGIQRALGEQLPRLSAAGRITATLRPASAAAPRVPAGAGPTALLIDPHGDQHRGWALANWAVARASADSVVQVSYGGRTWDRTAENPRAGQWESVPGGQQDMVVVLVSGG